MPVPEDEADAIAAEFARSWVSMKIYFTVMQARYRLKTESILALIKALQARGDDRIFRAGQSMMTFMLSRSRKHGLVHRQPFLAIDQRSEGGLRLRFYVGRERDEIRVPAAEMTTDDATLTPAIEALLQRLAAYPID